MEAGDVAGVVRESHPRLGDQGGTLMTTAPASYDDVGSILFARHARLPSLNLRFQGQ
mgnify:FL=1